MIDLSRSRMERGRRIVEVARVSRVAVVARVATSQVGQ